MDAVDAPPLELLYADEHLLAVDKPPGLAVHRSRLVGADEDYLIDRLRRQVDGPLHLAHRLDRATSGVLLVARSQEIAAELGRQLMARTVGKSYLAIVRGWPAEEGAIDYPLSGASLRGEAKPALVKGSLSRAIDVGAALRKGVASKDDALAPLKAATGGRVLFQGEATSVDWLSNEPYMWRELVYTIEGRGAWAGAAYKVWVKNEHHAIWRDDTVIATSPDIFAVLDPQTNKPLTTLGDVTPGRPVTVFGMKALDSAWHTAAGRALLGPRHFGLGFDYVDFEQGPR